jgi:signal transduction histidine kinase/CheY-like chemotaxis protein
MHIRSRLLALVLAILLPAFLSASLGIGYMYIEAQKSHRQSLRDTTRALALVLDKEIARREAILRTLAASPALDQGDLANFYQLARRMAPARDTTIILSDAGGRRLLNTRLPFATQRQPVVAAIDDLRKRYGPDDTVVSNVYFAPVGKSYSFSVEIPVKRQGRVLYFLEIGSFASHLQTVFEEQRLPAGWLGTIVDRNAVVVARSRNPEEYVGRQVKEAMARQLGIHSEGFVEAAVNLSGEAVVPFFSRAPRSEWSFIVSVPQSEMRRTAVRAIALTAGISLLLLGLAVALALVAARYTARPIEALRQAAERLGRGEPVTAQCFGIVEMDAVNNALARASEEIRSGKAELEQRVAEAVAAAERSQQALLQGQKLEALGRLTGGIAHDFNNVLQTLTTGLDVARLSNVEPRARSALEACERAVKRATELTRQLLAFGKAQDARVETINLHQQIEAITPMLISGLRSDINFQYDLTQPLWPVTLDPLQFELALLNLVMNARDAMPAGGILKLEARNETLNKPLGDLAPGDYVRLSVIDSGQGMSQEVLSRAFDPFFTTKSVGKGTGLGLAQAYGFAKQAAGTLILQSRPGEGTSATLYFPKSGPAVAGPLLAKSAAPAASLGGAVLFVEDDPLVRDVVTPALKAAGFQVLAARDGEEALALLDQGQHIDLVFSDIVMPGRLSGIDLAKTVQARFPGMRVVLATGYSDHSAALPGIRTLGKPYRLSEMVDALNGELRTGRGG